MYKITPEKVGHYAFARHCYKLGVDFDACYYMIFGKYPEK